MKIKSTLVFDKKVHLLTLGLLALVLVLIPTDIVHAGLGTTIANAIAGSILSVLERVLNIIQSILQVIFFLVAGGLLEVSKWVLGIGVAPNAPTTPLFVTDAFNIVLQLVNIFFILILVFIGLATILRFQTYELKKTLPWLLAMALLVNFSGVFVGFIVDISNLVTIWFLGQATTPDWNGVLQNVTSIPSTGEAGGVFAGLATLIASIIFYLVAILIYLVVLILFVVRTMFLWALVIIAPLAFASYVLPATRGKIWSEWWSQLIQWSIFVIPLSFFMWLASMALKFKFSDIPLAPGVVPLGSEASWFANFLSPFTALLLLYLGLMTSQRMAPAAAQGIMNLSKKGVGFATLKGGMALGNRFAPKITALGKEMRERGEGGENISEGAGRINLKKVFAATMNSRIMGSKVGRFGIRQVGTGMEYAGANAQIRIDTFNKQEAEQAKKSIEGLSPEGAMRKYENALGTGHRSNTRSSAILSGMKGDNVTDALKNGPISPKEFAKAFEIIKSQGGKPAKRAFINSFSNLLDEMGIEPKDQREALKDTFGNMKGAADIDKIDSSALKSKMVLDALGRYLTSQLAAQLLLRNPDDQGIILAAWEENIEEGAKRAKGDGEEANIQEKLKWADKNNYLSKVQWSVSTSAPGIKPLIAGIDQEDIKEYLKNEAPGVSTPEQTEDGEDEKTPPTAPAPKTPPSPGGAPRAARPPEVGDSVHWVSGGLQMTEKPKRIVRIEEGPGGKLFGFFTGSNAGMPVDELEIQISDRRTSSGGGTPSARQVSSEGADLARKVMEEAIKKIGVTSPRPPSSGKYPSESILLPLESLTSWAKKTQQEALLADKKTLNILLKEIKKVHAERLTEKGRLEQRGRSARNPEWGTSIDIAFKKLKKADSL